MILDRSHKAPLPLVLGFVLLLVCAASALWFSWQQRSADRWVRHTLEVENRLSSVQVTTARAEIHRRGLLLTGELRNVTLYKADRSGALNEARALAAAVVDNPPQERRAHQLIGAIEGKFGEMQRSMALQRAGETMEATRIITTADSRQRTTNLLNLLAAMRADEVRLLGQREAHSDHLRAIAAVTLLTSALLILGLALLVSRERRRRLMALSEANSQLERDIVNRKALELELQSERDRAEGAARSKATFLANMSHEIRTPMNGVVGFTELLLAGELTDKQRRQAELIKDSSRAMLRLLNDILDLSKVEAGQMTIAADTFDLHHALKACAALLQPAIEQRGVGFRCEIADDLPKLVVGDGFRLRQIVTNLIGNAAKFTSAGGIILRAQALNLGGRPVISIEVDDTGIGIADEHLSTIFDQFVQAETSITPRYGGTGLGLSISAQLARLMGGTLSVTSKLGQGSCFCLALPLQLAIDRRDPGYALAPLEPSPRPDEDTGSRSARVLVAEDHDVNQMLIGEMLEKLGYRFDLAVDGVEAVSMAEAGSTGADPYGLVLMDVQMPRLDGCEASRQIRESGISREALPIIALTANAYADDIAKCLNAGMQAHLSKPVSLESLALTIQRWAVKPPLKVAPAGADRFSPQLQERYRTRKDELFEKLEQLAAAEKVGDEDIYEVADMLHKFAGSAEMFGDGELGLAARALEVGLSTWSRQSRPTKLREALATMGKAA